MDRIGPQRAPVGRSGAAGGPVPDAAEPVKSLIFLIQAVGIIIPPDKSLKSGAIPV